MGREKMNRSTFFRSESTLRTSVCIAAFLAAGAVSTALFAQDECSNASVLTTGATAEYSTFPATPSAGIPVDTSCADSNLLWASNTPDVWFKWTAPADGVATFNACTANTTAIDSSLVLYTGSCGNLIQIACNGDALHNGSLGCNATDAKISGVKVTAGTVYYLRIGGISTDFGISRGSGQITVSLDRVVAWGDNSSGQCVVPAGLGIPKKLAGGYSHILAIKADNTIIGWGNNQLGQLNIPVSVTQVRDVAAGQLFSIAARADGTLVGWGSSTSGRATPPGTVTDAVAVAAGGFHGLALRSTGALVAWGAGGPSANNNGTLNNFGQSIVPGGLTSVHGMAAGNFHSVAVTTLGRVSAWGAGAPGSPAGSNYGQSTVPTGLDNVTKVSTGWFHSVALRADGTVACWGAGTTNLSSTVHWGQSAVPATLSGVIDIAGGQYFTIALRSDGTVVGWGHSTDHELTPPSWTGPLAAITTVGATSVAIFDGCPEDPTTTEDCVDNCPNDPLKREPGICGCGVPDVDTDNDGLMDCQDGCPMNPALTVPNTFFADSDADGFGDPASPVQSCTANPPAGAVVNSSDCNDALVTYADADGDGYGAGAFIACGTVSNATDCNDSVSAINPGATELCDAGNTDENCNNLADNADAGALESSKSDFYRDQDGDAFTVATATRFCDIVTGYSATVSILADCNDTNAAINPAANEICDAANTDENCNDLADNADSGALESSKSNFYADGDSDTFSTAAASRFCDRPLGYFATASSPADCNDAAADVYPGAVENCANRGIDNNCDGIATSDAEAVDATDYFADNDGDTFGAGVAVKSCVALSGHVLNSGDCNDGNGEAFPGASEVCANHGVDNDCDGVANDPAESTDALTYYADSDLDGFGNAAAPSKSCEPSAPAGFAANSSDCDDTTLLYPDVDNDGFGATTPAACGIAVTGDCNDGSASISPGAVELCNQIDDDCNGIVDDKVVFTDYYPDADQDGFGAATATPANACAPVAGHVTDHTDCDDAHLMYADADGDGHGAGAPVACGVLTNDDGCADNPALLAAATYYRDADGDGFGALASTTSSCATTIPVGYVANSSDCNDAAILYADADGDGFGAGAPAACGVATNTDCDDARAAVNPGATEVCDPADIDENCNSLVDDADATVSAASKSNFFADLDNDTYTVATASRFCDQPTGFRATASAAADCNDSDAAVNPAAAEVCDTANTDENCNGLADNNDAGALDSTKSNFFADLDGDTYTVAAASRFCDQPIGYRAAASAAVDCNDSRAGINPGTSEICDALDTDENCNGLADNNDPAALDAGKTNYYADLDGDNFSLSTAARFCDRPTNYRTNPTNQTDCNDSDPAINPAATEVCDAANTDENCNNLADNADATAADAGKTNFFVDADNDTFTLSTTARFCDLPTGYRAAASTPLDCNDASAAINPAATEVCDATNTDENCNGLADDADSTVSPASRFDFFADLDADNFTVASASRFCDQPVRYRGAATAQADCDDANAAINPAATELCDIANTDENCNGLVDDADPGTLPASKFNFWADLDDDTFTVSSISRFCDQPARYRTAASASADCNDANAAINPAATELCDAADTDENCNNLADNNDAGALDSTKSNFWADLDNDTYTVAGASRFCDQPANFRTVASTAADCNDAVAAINPAASEICDAANTDENCNNLADNNDAGALDSTKSNFWADLDNDAYTVAAASRFCDQPALHRAAVSVAVDCNDANASINPGATEVCDAANTDENCNNLADNADATAADAGKTAFWADLDDDAYTVAASSRFCDQPALFRTAVSSAIDCNDARADVNPGKTEICDAANTDENCNNVADDLDAGTLASTKTSFWADLDNDAYTVAAESRFCDQPALFRTAASSAIDCNDGVAAINPGMTEICDAADTDENCNNLADNADAGALESTKTDFWADADADTYTVAAATRFCDIVTGFVVAASADVDCNDARADINPGKTELCDSADTDENCNNLADNADAGALESTKTDFWADADADAYTVAAATRFCDIVTGFVVAASADVDCNDARADINPGKTELCDAADTDENCNNLADNADAGALESTKTDFWADADADTYTVAAATRFCDQPALFRTAASSAIDCNDGVAAINPGMTEICDASDTDENCNNLADNADAGALESTKTDFWADADADAYTVAAATRFCDIVTGFVVAASADVDCNDARADINPGKTELCDSADTDENCNNLADNADAGALESTKTDFWADADADAYTVAAATRFCDIVTGFVVAASADVDCNDARADINPGMTELCDAADTDENCNNVADDLDAGALESTKTDFWADLDGDTYTVAAATRFCDQPALFRTAASSAIDCNDGVAAINPGMTEICDAADTDENCNNLADNADAGALESTKTDFWADADADTYTVAAATRFCDIVTGFVVAASADVDCNDARADINPGMTEICDAADTDENCNNLADNADAGALESTKTDFWADADADAYTVAAATRFCDIVTGFVVAASADVDCNDARADINPGKTELCDAADTDENCNNLADNADAGALESTKTDFWADADADTYTVAAATRFCDQPALFRTAASSAIDCNDGVAAINPGMTEICDAADTDENCNNLADNADAGALESTKTDFWADADADTYTVAAATRFCDIVTGFVVAASADVDCNDARADINPGKTELCDSADTDENCNNLADNADAGALESTKTDFWADADADAYTVAAATRFCDIVTGFVVAASADVDCNDARADINPGKTELCDAADTDENCNNLADNADAGALESTKTDFWADADADTYTVAAATRFCDQPALYRTEASAAIDCNDANADINPGKIELCDSADTDEDCNDLADNADAGALESTKTGFYADLDSDGFTIADASAFCDKPSLFVEIASHDIDCNDADAAINPAATELCDANDIDENCNNRADNADLFALESTKTDFFADLDSDGFTVAGATRFCDIVSGYLAAATAGVDCDDAAPLTFPGAAELCSTATVDNNCDGVTADIDALAADKVEYFRDGDLDNFTIAETALFCPGSDTAGYLPAPSERLDCDDSRPSVYPGAVENCANLDIDNDCNGSTAESEAIDRLTFFGDADADLAGDPATTTLACSVPTGFVDNANDACPGNGELVAKVTYFADADSDGEGDPAISIQTCDSSAPAGYSATSGDGCPSDPAKIAPGTCGCGVADVDSDGDLILDCVDNCPAVVNADQFNCDTDSLGNACDADDDNDGAADINDAYACEAGRSDLDAGYSAEEITAFLTGATAATVDGTGMTFEQLRAVALLADHVAANGLGGTFTLDKRLSAGEIKALLGKAAPATGFLGGANITIDALDMTHAQLDEVVGAIGSVSTIVRLTVDATFDAASITALVSRSAEGEATVVATGMSQAQILAGVSGPNAVHVRGEFHIDASYTAEQIAAIMGSIVAGQTTVTVDSSGMSAAQQGALQSGASLVIDSDTAVAAGGTFKVYVDVASLPLHAVGVQASVSFDPTMLEFVASEPIGGIDFPWTLFTQQTADSVRFSTGVDLGGDRTGIVTGNVAQLTFRALHPLCGATSLVWLTPSGFDTCITSAANANGNSVAIPYSVVNRASITSLNSVTFAGLPGATVLPADAGSTFGAYVAEPVVTAANNCEAVSVTIAVQYPASSGLPAGNAWPNQFPVGVTTITWSAIDPIGNVHSASRTVEVLDHQIAVLDVQLRGVIVNPSYVLPIRVQLDGEPAFIAEVAFHGSLGQVREIQVPVRAGYTCMNVKDAEHTLAASLPVGIVGTRYVTEGSFELVGGDSNDDNIVDIIDFGALAVDRGADKDALSRSNFSRDGFVNTNDLTYIAINFLRRGESCVSGFGGREPLARVSVKDLRRMGLGEMVAADVNGDGWVDATDIALVSQGAMPSGHAPHVGTSRDANATRW